MSAEEDLLQQVFKANSPKHQPGYLKLHKTLGNDKKQITGNA